MNTIKSLHRMAMEHSDLAISAKQIGDMITAQTHLSKAYELEAEAANALFADLDAEPTRSVLFRSAATLAKDCGFYIDAERLVHKALSGKPSKEIADELRDLLDQIDFQRHLELRGIELNDEEIQLVISGNSVGFGVAPTDVFLSCVRSTENLLYRTAERTQRRPYRDRGRRNTNLAENMQLFMTAPRAACFAVTLRVGASIQPSLPGLSRSEPVIDELFDCLKLFEEGDDDTLKTRINEDAYFRNFMGLARSLQPDGDRINLVGFTAIRNGKTKQVALRRTPENANEAKSAAALQQSLTTSSPTSKHETIQIRGTLLIANATRKSNEQSGEIEIVSNGIGSKIIVPPGMMSDIVKPLWEEEVDVLAIRKGKKLYLVQVKPAS